MFCNYKFRLSIFFDIFLVKVFFKIHTNQINYYFQTLRLIEKSQDN
jgi:hypothetical protein